MLLLLGKPDLPSVTGCANFVFEFSSASVGFFASVVETPVDLVKCKLQATNEYPGVFAAMRGLYKKFGLPALWQG